jgi:hypothetical protein
MSDDDTLRMIKDVYGGMIFEAARAHKHRPEVIAGIMMRETEGGEDR